MTTYVLTLTVTINAENADDAINVLTSAIQMQGAQIMETNIDDEYDV